jgi:hypothetical protein
MYSIVSFIYFTKQQTLIKHNFFDCVTIGIQTRPIRCRQILQERPGTEAPPDRVRFTVSRQEVRRIPSQILPHVAGAYV